MSIPSALLAHPNHLPALITALSPDHAVIMAALGLCLTFLELNRPGRILPGTCGLTLLLLATASLLHHPLRPAALLTLLIASAILTVNLWKQLPLPFAIAAIILLALSLRFLIPQAANPHITTPTALTCGLGLGLLGTALSRSALRARRLKAVH